MTDKPVQPPDHPIWADLASPNIEASKELYGGLFGWEAETAAGPEAGSYTMFRLNGKMVAAVQTTMDGQMPPVWRAYIHAADADAMAEKARNAGATMFMEPMDVFDTGRLAFFADPTGAAIGLWQPKSHPGAEVMNEPGSLGWIELATRDMEAAKGFYKAVFGWDAKTSEGDMPYTEWQIDGNSIAGAMEMGPEREGIPPHWLVYFSAEDTDKSAARLEELGGKLLVPPSDFPGGRFAIGMDQHGSSFGLLTLRQ